MFDIRNLNVLQLKLINKAASLVKVGGIIVYSTCSIEPEENYDIVKKFLDENSNFRFESAKGKFPDEIIDETECIQTLHHIHKTDGASAARLVRVS